MNKKMITLYQVFNEASSTKKESIYNDALEFFSLLISELGDPSEGQVLRPLWHELLYLRDSLK
jgi:hypothetical protein